MLTSELHASINKSILDVETQLCFERTRAATDMTPEYTIWAWQEGIYRNWSNDTGDQWVEYANKKKAARSSEGNTSTEGSTIRMQDGNTDNPNDSGGR